MTRLVEECRLPPPMGPVESILNHIATDEIDGGDESGINRKWRIQHSELLVRKSAVPSRLQRNISGYMLKKGQRGVVKCRRVRFPKLANSHSGLSSYIIPTEWTLLG